MCKLRAILIEKRDMCTDVFFSLTCWLLRSFICIYIFTCICSDVSLYLDLLVHEALHLHFYLYLYLYFFRYVILPWLACSWGFVQECLSSLESPRKVEILKAAPERTTRLLLISRFFYSLNIFTNFLQMHMKEQPGFIFEFTVIFFDSNDSSIISNWCT